MGLYRFGEGAIRLDRVVAIRRVRIEGKDEPLVKVFFEGSQAVAFKGPEADAILAFLRLLSVPTDDAKSMGYGSHVTLDNEALGAKERG